MLRPQNMRPGHVCKILPQGAEQICTSVLLVVAGWLLLFSDNPANAQSKTDDATESITALIHKYERAVSDADATLAGEVWRQTADVSFIHPLGHEHGWEEIKRNIYEKLMGQVFSERQLTASNISVHSNKDAAWAEFNWVFVAKLRSNGSPVKTEGTETQVYFKTADGWRLVHVHYSNSRPGSQTPGGGSNPTN